MLYLFHFAIPCKGTALQGASMGCTFPSTYFDQDLALYFELVSDENLAIRRVNELRQIFLRHGNVLLIYRNDHLVGVGLR